MKLTPLTNFSKLLVLLKSNLKQWLSQPKNLGEDKKFWGKNV